MLAQVTISLLICFLGCWALRPGPSRNVLKRQVLAPSSLDTHIRTARLSRRLNRTVIVVIDCETVPCKNNATCHHESHCECAPGWTGHVCDKEVTHHVQKYGFETELGLTSDPGNEVDFQLATYSEYIGRGTEGNSYALVQSDTTCHYHTQLYSDPIYTENSLLIEFDYTTYGNGVLNFHMLDTDGYGTYHLLFDTGNNGIWKSFSYSIAGGYNIQYYFSAVTGGDTWDFYGAVAIDNLRITVQK
eukprot:XP_011413709.1 PREDICTED: uncharacterized protein LOC105318350 [Crassostrea gigas]